MRRETDICAVLTSDRVSSARRLHYTYAQYLALEEMSAIRHEYLGGEIYAMAGGTPDHAGLAARVLALLGAQLPRGCRAYTSDLRVFIPGTGLATYPDAAVVCGGTKRPSEDRLAVVNPVLLVEVTSDSTEEYDRGEKLRHYKELSSLQDVLFVSHRAARLTLHHRQEGLVWTTSEAEAGQALELPSMGGRIAVDDVYRDGLEDATPT
jgi:Uma2 family endonuclease